MRKEGPGLSPTAALLADGMLGSSCGCFAPPRRRSGIAPRQGLKSRCLEKAFFEDAVGERFAAQNWGSSPSTLAGKITGVTEFFLGRSGRGSLPGGLPADEGSRQRSCSCWSQCNSRGADGVKQLSGPFLGRCKCLGNCKGKIKGATET